MYIMICVKCHGARISWNMLSKVRDQACIQWVILSHAACCPSSWAASKNEATHQKIDSPTFPRDPGSPRQMMSKGRFKHLQNARYVGSYHSQFRWADRIPRDWSKKNNISSWWSKRWVFVAKKIRFGAAWPSPWYTPWSRVTSMPSVLVWQILV